MRSDSTQSEPPIDLPLRQREPAVETTPRREHAPETPADAAGGGRAVAAGMLVLGLLAGFGAGFVVGQRLSVPAPPRAVEVPRPAPIQTVPPVQMALPPPVAPLQTTPEPAVEEVPVVLEEPQVLPPPPPAPPARSVEQPAAPAPAPRSVERPAAPVVEPATIRFDSRPPGATVYLDEVRLGVTPLTIDMVTPGTHQVRMEMLGHDTWRTSVTVKAGEQIFVGGSLE